MKKRLILAGIVLLAGVVISLLFRLENNRGKQDLILSGNVEVTEVNIGFKTAGRVQRLFTDEGKTVAQGDKIASLDSAELDSLVHQNKASVRNAEALFEKAKKDHDRFLTLYRDGVIASQQMDAAKAVYDAALSQLQLSRAGLRTSDVRLKDSVVYAPLTGVVLKRNIEEGETVAAGITVMTIGDLENPWVKVYVKEDNLGLVKLGQKAEVQVDSFPGKKYEGTVTSISSEAEFTPRNVQTREERVKLVFGVKLSVKNQNAELKPGMPADVKILLKNSSESGVRSSE